ncbi:hypothetical protein QJS66_19655 [Kocuria rhizophila]|nr:hypothetical protein QJS66_19655 [Kocuria rhizophila]
MGWGILQDRPGARPRLGKKAERESLQRTIASTAENGMPRRPVATIGGRCSARARSSMEPVGTASRRGVHPHRVHHGRSNLERARWRRCNALLDVRKIRRSWRYLKAMHTALGPSD